MSTVLVFGGNGYVGGAIVAALARSGRHRVLAAGRGPARPSRLDGVQNVTCDATDAQAVRQAASGVSAIVNSVLGDRETMLAACCNICAAAGAARVVHVSTMSVYGPARGRVDESWPLDPSESPYGAAKVACEQVIGEFVAAGGDAVLLRPGIVHGPGGQQWTGRLGRMLHLGRLGDLGEQGDGRCNLTYIDDLGAAALAAVEADRVRGEAFNVSDPEPPTWNQYLVGLGVRIGAAPVGRLSARRMKLETKLLAPPLQIMKLAAARAGIKAGKMPEPIPPSLLRLFSQDIALDHRKADSGLGFPRTPPERAMAEASTWFRTTHGG